MEYNSLKTGQTYKLQDLFSKDNKIIIPDLQRDYCWGTTNDKEGKNLVERFIDNLIENKDKELNLGLLYGYEAPLGHIQLCDGQQRITTLFLLLGMLNKKTNDTFRRYLISEKEESDDWEPYLQYSIRESSLYFLSDLTRFFFIENKNLSVSDIKMQPWYFKDYDLDPSIKSMIAAMGIIENKIENEFENNDCKIFGEHIAEQLSFLYYDMGNRTKGEETFVVINTTGEPLSPTENLKPLLISRQLKEKQDECAQKWETWEQFFWKYRGKNDTADNGLKEFFRWIMLLHVDGFQSKILKDGIFAFDINIPFYDINKYFDSVLRLFEGDGAIFSNKDWLCPTIKGNTQIDLLTILPVIEYVYRNPDADHRDILRIKMFFENYTRIKRIKDDPGRVIPDAIHIVRNLPNNDICEATRIENVSETLMSNEVKFKLEIYRDSSNRNEIEDAFWKEEEYKLWSGEILPMLKWATVDDVFDYNSFKTYRDKFNKLFHGNLEYEDLDTTRRALLTCNLKDYPRIFYGYKNWSFAWDYEDWKALINDNVDKFKSFLDEMDIDDIYAAQNQMIKNNPSEKDFDEFVKIPELLKYCHKKKIQWGGDELGWNLIKENDAREYANLKTYRLYLEIKGIHTVNDVWFYGKERSCAVIDENSERNGWAIDLWHSGNDRYTLNLFRRKDAVVENTFDKLPGMFSLKWNGERYERENLTKEEVKELVFNIIEQL